MAVRRTKKTTTKKKTTRRTRAEFEPTLEQRAFVSLAASCGIGQEAIGRALYTEPDADKPIGKEKLREHFEEELRAGGEIFSAKVYQEIAHVAFNRDHPKQAQVLMFIARCRLGWTETIQHKHEKGKGVGVLVVPAAMPVEDWVEQQRAKHETDDETETLFS